MIVIQRGKNSENWVIKLKITENRTPSQVLFLEFLNYLKKEECLSPVAYYDVHITTCRLHRQTNLTSKFSEASKILIETIIAIFLCYSFQFNQKLHNKKFLNAKRKVFFSFSRAYLPETYLKLSQTPTIRLFCRKTAFSRYLFWQESYIVKYSSRL